MAISRSGLALSSVLALAAAAGAWLLLCGEGTGNADVPGSAGAAATAPASATHVALQAQTASSAAAPEAPAGSVARTELPSPSTAEGDYRLTARFVDGTRAPIAGVELGLFYREGTSAVAIEVPLRDARAMPAVSSRTDRDGRCELRVRPGVGAALRVLGEQWYVRQEGSTLARSELTIAALTGDRDLGDVMLGRCAQLAGVVQNEAGKPVGGVRVHVSDKATLAPFDGLASVLTGDDGRFACVGLKPGKHVLRTESPHFLPARLEFDLREAERRDDVVVTLGQGDGIAGVVLDDRGTPVTGIRVGADRARELSPGLSVQSSSVGESTTTDADGRFTLRGLEGNAVNVQAWGAGFARGVTPNVAVGATDVVVRVARLGAIAGVVLDGAGKPVAGSRVRARVANDVGPTLLGGFDVVETDSAGKWELASVRPGPARVVVEGEGHLEAESRVIEVLPGQRTDGVEVVVQRGATLAVRVLDARGEPVVGALVSVCSADGDSAPIAGAGIVRRNVRVRGGRGGPGPDLVLGDQREHGSATTGADGVARIGGLPASSVVARCKHDKFAPVSSAPLTLPAAGEVSTELRVAMGGFLRLQVQDADRAALAGAHYKLQGPVGGDGAGEPRTERGQCDSKGLAMVGPLLPGKWKVRSCLPPRPMQLGDGLAFALVSDQGHEFAETETVVEIVAGLTTPVALTQPRLTTLRGTVSDTSGPVRGAKVKLEAEGGPTGFASGYSATTGDDGTFELTSLPGGKYLLRYGYPDALVMSEEALEISSGQVLVERTLLLRTGTVRVTVNSEAGEPLAGARVTLEKSRRRDAPALARREVRMITIAADAGEGGSTTSITAGDPSAVTDVAGEVEIAHVPEGDYVLRIEHPQHVRCNKPEVRVLEGASLDLGVIQLAPAGELRGAILGWQGKAPMVAHVEVTKLSGDEQRIETAINGSYRVTSLAPGRYRVEARLIAGPDEETRASAPMEVEIGKGERKVLDLQLR